MSKFKRKIKKFFKTPRLFFKDSRIFKSGGQVSIVNSPSATNKYLASSSANKINFSSLSNDYTTPHEQEVVLFCLLNHAGINYHVVNTGWEHIIRVAIQDSYVKNIIDLIRSSYLFKKNVYIVEGKNKYDLVRLYFHDAVTVYKEKIIQLDPWYVTPSGIMTRNTNKQIQFIPKAHVNRTVHSFAPIRLGRDSADIDDLKAMTRIDRFLFDEYEKPIDIVFTWVSDGDPEWLQKKNFYSEDISTSSNTRFVDYEQLRYSLRSVAYYAKFIRNIFIVTDNQVPYWLDESNERIIIVNHKDIFSDTSVLPVFNSVAIESWIHKIKGLSDNFIYANDDYFFGGPVNKNTFINPNGVAKLFLEAIPNAYGEIFEDSESTSKLSLFSAQCFYEKFNKWPSFWPLHAPMIKNIHAMEEMISEFSDVISKTSRSRFRESGTISPLYLMSSYFSYQKGYSVVSQVKYDYVSTDSIDLDRKLTNLRNKINSNNCDIFCLNDHRTVSDEQIHKVIDFMKMVFPLPAEWELDKDHSL